MITLTVIRHGESTDNLRPVWGGWADAPLSVHGMNQAKALGESLAGTKVDALFSSDLLRAHWTAQQVHRQQPDPKPFLTTSPLLREQHFGQAEQQPFGTGRFVRQPGRTFKFDDGESLEDVRNRANAAIERFIEPILRETKGRPPTKRHVVVVAHGIFNSEFIGAFLARSRGGGLDWGYKGMTNTGWTRMEVGYADETLRAQTTGVLDSEPAGPQSPSTTPAAPPPMNESVRRGPELSVRILCSDVTKHLDGVHRQKGGIGRQGYDEKQQSLHKFFGGGSTH